MAFQSLHPIKSIKDIRSLEETPLSEAYDVKSTYELFVNSAKAFGDKTALRFLKTGLPGDDTLTLSYQELLEKIHQTANLLYSLGVQSTDTVSILLPGCNEYHLALWGGEAAGIVNPLNPLLTVEKLTNLMNAANSKVLIAYGDKVENGFWDKALKLREDVKSLQTILRVAPHDDETIPDLADGIEDFSSALAKQERKHLISNRTFSPDDIAAYFHTGGTTGSPKLAKHSHGNQVFTAWASVQMQGLRNTDKTINGYPLFHVAGVLPGALSALSAGVETIIPTPQLLRNKEIIQNYWKLVEYHKVTSVSAVPTALSAISSVPLDGADISTVTYCRTGAAPLPPELAQRYQDLYGLHIHESLGMTEMAGISSITPPGVKGPVGSVGFPLPYARFKIAELAADGSIGDTEIEAGQSGMLLVKSPNIFPGYINETETKKTFTKDGWLISGDIGFIDEKGRLNLSGRAKDLIIRSGHNIDPKTIEDVLDHHEAVDLCAAVAAPCPYAGELPVAYVTLKQGKHVTERELFDYVAERIEETPAKPKSVRIIPSMPQTNVGKIFKPELRRLAAEMAVKHFLKDAGDVTGKLDDKGQLSLLVSFSEKLPNADQTPLENELLKFPVPIAIA